MSSSTPTQEERRDAYYAKHVFTGLRYGAEPVPFDKLKSHEKQALHNISTAYKQDVHRVLFAQNSGQDHFGGHAVVLGADAKLLPTANVPKNAFSVRLMNRLRDPDMEDDSLRCEGKQALHSAIASALTETDPGLVRKSDCADSRPWQAYRTEGGAVTVHSTEDKDGRQRYFLTVDSSLGAKAESDLRELAADMTASQYATSEEVSLAKSQAMRNAQRIMNVAAEALGQQLETAYDLEAATPQNEEMPRLTLPDVVVAHNTVNTFGEPGSSGHAVVFYNGCADGAQGSGGTLVKGDHADRMYEYAFNDRSTGELCQFLHSSDVSNMLPSSAGYLSGDAAGKVPVHIERMISNHFVGMRHLDDPMALMRSAYGTHSKVDTKTLGTQCHMYGLDSTARCYKPVVAILF